MSVHAIYRVCIWLPLLVPAAVLILYRRLGVSPADEFVGVEVLAYSLIVGGIPYAALAAWATWWIGGGPEATIRRLMFVAPLLMVALFTALAIAAGLWVGRPVKFLGVAALGASVILVLGYAYVGLTVAIRQLAGPRIRPA
jgi:hypothetical protein